MEEIKNLRDLGLVTGKLRHKTKEEMMDFYEGETVFYPKKDDDFIVKRVLEKTVVIKDTLVNKAYIVDKSELSRYDTVMI